jgi:hypothetical protein
MTVAYDQKMLTRLAMEAAHLPPRWSGKKNPKKTKHTTTDRG